jgi:hypothetical protein
MMIYYHKTGPQIGYRDGVLFIDDLNPQMRFRWMIGRKEMLTIAWRCFVAAIKG